MNGPFLRNWLLSAMLSCLAVPISAIAAPELEGNFIENVISGTMGGGFDQFLQDRTLVSLTIEPDFLFQSQKDKIIDLRNLSAKIPSGKTDDRLCVKYQLVNASYVGLAIFKNLGSTGGKFSIGLRSNKWKHLSNFKLSELRGIAYRSENCNKSKYQIIAPIVIASPEKFLRAELSLNYGRIYISLVDHNGSESKEIRCRKKSSPISTHNCLIDLSNFSAGLYTLKIRIKQPSDNEYYESYQMELFR